MPCPWFEVSGKALTRGAATVCSALFRWAVVALLAWMVAWAVPAGAQTQTDPEASDGPLRAVAERVTERAMVVTANPHATQAGLEILRAGGTAVDAAAAAALALNVVEPQSSGVGGGAFALLAMQGREPVTAWDGREEAPAAVTPEWFLRPDGSPQPYFPDRITGGRPVGVPGLVKLLDGLLAQHGKLGWPRIVQPAIRLAEDGFPVSPRLARALAVQAKRLARFPATRAQFLHPDGSPLREGETLLQPDLARTLRRLAEAGAKGFYEGPLAEAMVRTVNEAPVNPGRLSLADLSGYAAPRRAPVSVAYRGYTVYGMGPPSSGGIAVAQTLALLAEWPAPPVPRPAAAEAHRFTQATRLAFADRERYVADADFVPVPTRGLLDLGYLASRAQALAWEAALSPVEAGTPPGADLSGALGTGEDTEYVSTSHLTVVDAERNAVALTSSVEFAFGSGMVVPGWGFLLNNELTDFNALPADGAGRPAANRPEGSRRPRATALDLPPGQDLPAARDLPAGRDVPAARDLPAALGGKRPRSSMAPTLVFRQGRLVLTLGSPGGARIIPYVALTLTRVLDEGLALQAAIAAPLLVHGRGTTVLEPEWSPEVAPALRKLGHRVVVDRMGSGLHGILLDADGRLHSGVDPRREGAADGY